jgi:hypothetical protein
VNKYGHGSGTCKGLRDLLSDNARLPDAHDYDLVLAASDQLKGAFDTPGIKPRSRAVDRRGLETK